MWSMLKNKKASPEKATILRKAAALCMVFAMFAAGCSQKQETSGDFKEGFLTPEKTNYKTVKVEMGGYERVRTGTATVVFPLQFKLSWEEDGTYYQEAAVTVGQAVKEGETVRKGEAIALVGETGYATGNHLHFEVLLNGKYINPLYVLSYDF